MTKADPHEQYSDVWRNPLCEDDDCPHEYCETKATVTPGPFAIPLSMGNNYSDDDGINCENYLQTKEQPGSQPGCSDSVVKAFSDAGASNPH